MKKIAKAVFFVEKIKEEEFMGVIKVPTAESRMGPGELPQLLLCPKN